MSLYGSWQEGGNSTFLRAPEGTLLQCPLPNFFLSTALPLETVWRVRKFPPASPRGTRTPRTNATPARECRLSADRKLCDYSLFPYILRLAAPPGRSPAAPILPQPGALLDAFACQRLIKSLTPRNRSCASPVPAPEPDGFFSIAVPPPPPSLASVFLLVVEAGASSDGESTLAGEEERRIEEPLRTSPALWNSAAAAASRSHGLSDAGLGLIAGGSGLAGAAETCACADDDDCCSCPSFCCCCCCFCWTKRLAASEAEAEAAARAESGFGRSMGLLRGPSAARADEAVESEAGFGLMIIGGGPVRLFCSVVSSSSGAGCALPLAFTRLKEDDEEEEEPEAICSPCMRSARLGPAWLVAAGEDPLAFSEVLREAMLTGGSCSIGEVEASAYCFFGASVTAGADAAAAVGWRTGSTGFDPAT